MEFWGVEVKSGQPLDVILGEGKVLHLSQACLGEIKNNKSNESVCLSIVVEDKKLVLGTLHPERLPQQLFDLVFDKDFKISHNWKNGSVYFYGYKADNPVDEQQTESEDLDTDEEEEALRLPIPNGNKQEAKKEETTVTTNKKDKQKVKIVEPEKEDKKTEGDDSDSDSSDDSDGMSDDSDSDEDNEDSSDSDDSSEEDEETPKKQQSGKKRANDSAIKTPATDKKAKMSTPQKTDGKKPGGHVATPHPSKGAAKTPAANKSNQKSPASASDGAYSCKPCNRSFKTDGALQSHNQAKHK